MKTLLVLAISGMVNISWAGTIFEPSVSLGSASGSISTVASDLSGQNANFSATAANFGARYGITRRYVHVTAIIEGTLWKSDQDSGVEFTPFGGLGIGWEWNIPIRTYFLVGAFEFDTDFASGGVELSYFFSDSMWLGLRYLNMKSKLDPITIGTTDVDVEASMNLISLVLSFPFEFNYPDHWFRKTEWE